MPCLILTGHPCVGKSTFATLLASRARHKGFLSDDDASSVVIINEKSAVPDKTLSECYADSHAEKFTRAALKAEFERHCCSDNNKKNKLVILDSMNYIKGYRYELYCIAKAAGDRHAVIWLLLDPAIAKRWNTSRKMLLETQTTTATTTDCYESDELMEELVQRYEPPDQRNRWDSPLYRVDVASTLSSSSQVIVDEEDGVGIVAEEALQKSVYNMHSLSDAIRGPSQFNNRMKGSATFRRKTTTGATGFKKPAMTNLEATTTASEKSTIDESIVVERDLSTDHTGAAMEHGIKAQTTMEDIIDTILASFFMNVQPLKEGHSTRQQQHYSTAANVNGLHEVDAISQRMTASFLNAQKTLISGGGGRIQILLPNDSFHEMEMIRIVSHGEVKRYRRQFIQLASSNHPPSSDGMSETGIAKSFLQYLETQL